MQRGKGSPAEVTVPTSYLRSLVRGVEAQGHHRSALFGDEPVSNERLADDTPFPAKVFGRLYQRAIYLLGDESLGMVSAGKVPRGTFRMLCLLLIHCPHVGCILERAGEFLEVCHGMSIKPRVRMVPPYVEISIGVLDRLAGEDTEHLLTRASPARVRTTLYMWWNLLSWFAGRRIKLVEVRFKGGKPDDVKEWAHWFGVPLVFDTARSALLIEADALKFANVQNEHTLGVFLRQAPYSLMVPVYRIRSVRERVLAVIGEDFSQPLPSADSVAQQLNMSLSSLRRQLAAEGAAFQALKDEARRAAAIRYLAASELSLAEIAYLLGFREPSAFNRAFRRWTGCTPGEYRDSI